MKDIQGFLVTAILGAAVGYVVTDNLRKAQAKREEKQKTDSVIKPRVDPEYLYYDHDNIQL